jgi:oligogalacturonide lyase
MAINHISYPSHEKDHLSYLHRPFAAAVLPFDAGAQIGKRFPSERKAIKDPVTGTPLIFLTSTPAGDSEIYTRFN